MIPSKVKFQSLVLSTYLGMPECFDFAIFCWATPYAFKLPFKYFSDFFFALPATSFFDFFKYLFSLLSFFLQAETIQ